MTYNLRRRALVPAAIVAALALAGCTSTTSSGSGSSAAASGPVTVWVMGDSAKKFDELVAPFTKDTGIQVKTVAIPWDSIDQKMTTAVASGDGPDVLQIGLSKLRTFADTGALMTLDQAALADYPNLASSRFLPGIAGDATAVGGKVVSVPWISDTRVLFYRSDILTAAGISQPPATWDQLRTDAKKLAGRGTGQYGYYIPQWDSALPVQMTWAYGGDIVDSSGAVDFGTDAFGKAVDLYTGLYADGSVPTASDFDQTQGFVSGSTPMVVSGPYLAAAIKEAAPDLDGKWAVAQLPEATTSTALLAGSNLGVWGKTEHKDAALKLLDFLAQKDTQLSWYSINGDLPTVTEALSDSSLTSDQLVKVYAASLASAKILPLVPNWDGGTGKALLDALNSIALQGTDKATALATLESATKGQSVN
ncbi:MAG: extracellular solute-binding protein [Actinobacteria bacterium]|nr:extracellular solute-binding protein [Actinomycetota bacterium]